MSLEIRAVYQEIRGRVKEVWRLARKPVGYLAVGGSSLALACATQPTSEQVQKPQESQLPKDVTVVVVTNTLEPKVLPTAASEPIPATSTSEPVKPTVEPTPFTMNTPFLKDKVYGGQVYVELDGGNRRERKGYALFMSTLRQDLGAVFSYVLDATCPLGSPVKTIRSGGSIKVEPRSFLNRGFGQRGRFGEQLEGILIREGAVSGDITFPPHFVEYHPCGVGKIQWATSAKAEGWEAYLTEYLGLWKQVGLKDGLTTAEALAEIEKDIGGVKLPSPASK